jgi:hypothetical protein
MDKGRRRYDSWNGGPIGSENLLITIISNREAVTTPMVVGSCGGVKRNDKRQIWSIKMKCFSRVFFMLASSIMSCSLTLRTFDPSGGTIHSYLLLRKPGRMKRGALSLTMWMNACHTHGCSPILVSCDLFLMY